MRLKDATPDDFVPLVESEGQIVWERSSTGIFNTKAAMKILRGSGVKVTWENLVWGKGLVPRYAFTLWLICKKKLSTLDRLRKWGVSLTSSLCALCKGEEEAIYHLFFNCCMPRPVWTKVQNMCLVYRGSYTWDVELSWLAAHWRSNSFADQMRRLALATAVYHVWRLRNEVIFQF